MAKRQRAKTLSLVIAAMGAISLGISIFLSSPEDALIQALFALGGVCALLGAYIYYALATRFVRAIDINERDIWLNGVNDDYLNAFPRWPDAPRY